MPLLCYQPIMQIAGVNACLKPGRTEWGRHQIAADNCYEIE